MTSQAQSVELGAARRQSSPAAFFALVVALAVPFWILGALSSVELMPRLPIAALAFLCPGLAGLVLAGREGGWRGTLTLLARVLDARRSPSSAWWAFALALPLAVAAASWFLQRLTGAAVPPPQIAPMTVLTLTVLFFIAGAGEEIGWSGYVLDPLQARLGALRASLVIGAVWAAVHYVPLLQAHRPAGWIAWWTLGTLSMRVIMVWLYNRAGRSVFAVTLLHMASNLAWQLYPIRGSFFDPRIQGVLLLTVALALIGWDAAASRPAR